MNQSSQRTVPPIVDIDHLCPPGPTQVIGKSVSRQEDSRILTGRGQYVDDIRVPGTLYARFVRSPISHGRLLSIDTQAAKSAPGVQGVFTGTDLNLKKIVPPLTTPGVVRLGRPILPTDAVRFSGEAYAVVVAESQYEAEDAAELVFAEFEELTPIVNPALAASPDSELVHDLPSNVVFDRSHEFGDVDEVFAHAAVVIERTFRSDRVSATPMEPRAILAMPEDGLLRVHASTQIPHRMRTVLSEILDIPADDIAVSSPDLGGSFGLKGHIYPEDVVTAWLARRLNRAVKFVEDRTENLLASSHARDQVITARVAADNDGHILALEADVVSDIGAYGVDAHGPTLEAGGTPSMIPGPYQMKAYRYRTRAVCTNKCPQGAYRGVGLPMSVLTHERMMDLVAIHLKIDRADIRHRNFITSEQMPYQTTAGRTYDNGDYARALDNATRMIQYDKFEDYRKSARSRGRLAGLGLASFVEYTGMNRREYQNRGMLASAGVDSVRIRLSKDGTATLWTTMPTVGQGIGTAFAQIAGSILGVPVENIAILTTDTSESELLGQGTGASRGMVVGGNAVYEAAMALRHKLVQYAATALALPSSVIEYDGASFTQIDPHGETRSVSREAVIEQQPDGYAEATSTYESPAVSYSYATHACIVEINPETGHVAVVDYAVSDDCGRAINPMIVKGQVRGAVVQGIGAALYEQHKYDTRGQLQSASFMDYLVPTATDVPDIRIDSFEMPAPSNPLGTKGIGESGTLGPPAAIANAVSDALGSEFNSLPITPPQIRSALRITEAFAGVAS